MSSIYYTDWAASLPNTKGGPSTLEGPPFAWRLYQCLYLYFTHLATLTGRRRQGCGRSAASPFLPPGEPRLLLELLHVKTVLPAAGGSLVFQQASA